MKKLLICLCIVLLQFNNSYAKDGEMSYFGGVSEGYKLPKTIDRYVTPTEDDEILRYKEVIFLTGKPLVFEGNVEMSVDDIPKTSESGSISEEYEITPYKRNPEDAPVINRSIEFRTNYYKRDNQLVKDSFVEDWTEVIEVDGTTYTLDGDESYFEKSVFVDKTPGVNYYRGQIDYQAVYYTDSDQKITLEVSGPIYGYDEPWSKTETHKLNILIRAEGDEPWQLTAKVTPSVSVKKTIKYSGNEPTISSFEGNYAEIITNHGALNYEVFVTPENLTEKEKRGSLTIPSFNSSEQLMMPKNIKYLKASFAEDDIKKLYSMEVFEKDPRFFYPSQAMNRSKYIRALCRAMRLEEELNPDAIAFYDVDEDHPDYGYITRAFEEGLVNGFRGKFNPERPLTREEAVVIYMRILGLENLGLDPTIKTPFVDDNKISNWAKKEIYAAYNLGLVNGDPTGKFRPKDYISNQEGAALINNMINYLRYDIEKDYKEKIINN